MAGTTVYSMILAQVSPASLFQATPVYGASSHPPHPPKKKPHTLEWPSKTLVLPESRRRLVDCHGLGSLQLSRPGRWDAGQSPCWGQGLWPGVAGGGGGSRQGTQPLLSLPAASALEALVLSARPCSSDCFQERTGLCRSL